ncbi:MAG: hypothetical protein M3P50_08750 [Actinomycetota bacterium]|nr:hypothetical protein [Actinomycetota bacterium]
MQDANKSAGLAGLCFVAAMVVGFSLQPALDFDAAATKFASQLADGKSALLASGLAVAVAAVALHWFLASLRAAFDPAGGEPAALVLAPAGAAAAALLSLGFLSIGALAAWTPAGGADPAALQTAGRLANAAANVALLPLAAAGLATATLGRRGAAPAWIAVLGALAAVVSVAAAGRAFDELGFLALLMWLVWAAGLAISLLRRERAGRAPATGRASAPRGVGD